MALNKQKGELKGNSKEWKVRDGKVREGNQMEENDSSYFAKEESERLLASKNQQYYPLRYNLWSVHFFAVNQSDTQPETSSYCSL